VSVADESIGEQPKRLVTESDAAELTQKRSRFTRTHETQQIYLDPDNQKLNESDAESEERQAESKAAYQQNYYKT
jgi:hypothetical protein